MLRKVSAFAMLIAIVLASFPSVGVQAAGGEKAKKLEAKWSQYVKHVNEIAYMHDEIDTRAAKWLKEHKDAPGEIKTLVANHLKSYHTNLDAAKAIIQAREGFNAKGKVVDLGAADKTIKHLGEHIALLGAAWRGLKDFDNHFKH